MKWKDFSTLVNYENCSSTRSQQGKISLLLNGRGTCQQVEFGKHRWYPKGVANNEQFNGYRYIDINQSFNGDEPVLISEASCCMIVLLLDKGSRRKFGAHISAASDIKSRLWLAMKLDLFNFIKKMSSKFDNLELYIFSNNTYKNAEGSHEQRNFMKLFESALSYDQLKQLAKSTYIIEGEAGKPWNPFCAVRLGEEKGVPQIKVTFSS